MKFKIIVVNTPWGYLRMLSHHHQRKVRAWNSLLSRNFFFSPGFGGRGCVVAIGGSGFCEGNGGLGPSSPSPVGHGNMVLVATKAYVDKAT